MHHHCVRKLIHKLYNMTFPVSSFKSFTCVASNILEQAQQLSQLYQNTTATKVDVTSEQNLGSLIREHELVVR